MDRGPPLARRLLLDQPSLCSLALYPSYSIQAQAIRQTVGRLPPSMLYCRSLRCFQPSHHAPKELARYSAIKRFLGDFRRHIPVSRVPAASDLVVWQAILAENTEAMAVQVRVSPADIFDSVLLTDALLPGRYYFMGFSTCLSLFVEEKKRRGELAMYVMPKALESAWASARRRSYVPFSECYGPTRRDKC